MDLYDTARSLAESRLERDRRIAEEAGCPTILKIDAYMIQAIRDALVIVMSVEDEEEEEEERRRG